MPNYRSTFRYLSSTEFFTYDVTAARSCDAWDATKNALSSALVGTGQNPEGWKKHTQEIVEPREVVIHLDGRKLAESVIARPSSS